jgi:hypothetical protein
MISHADDLGISSTAGPVPTGSRATSATSVPNSRNISPPIQPRAGLDQGAARGHGLPEEHRDEESEQITQLPSLVFSRTLTRVNCPNARSATRICLTGKDIPRA